MSEILVIWRYETRQILGRKQFLIMLAVWTLIIVGVPLYVFAKLQAADIISKITDLVGDGVVKQYYCDTYVSRYPFIVILLSATSLLSEAFHREKMLRTIEFLLSTHVRPWQILLGKVLAVSSIGIVFAFIVTVVFLLTFNMVAHGPMVLPSTAGWLNATLWAPLLAIVFFLLTGIFELATQHARFIHLLVFFLGFGLLYLSAGGTNLDPTNVAQVASRLSMAYVAAIIVGILIAVFSFRMLTPEQILLTGGD